MDTESTLLSEVVYENVTCYEPRPPCNSRNRRVRAMAVPAVETVHAIIMASCSKFAPRDGPPADILARK
eukprot:760537-Hanusia_phi.AAC.1